MRIAYLSNNIYIHDWRFLTKILEGGNEVFLFTYHDLDDPRITECFHYITQDVVNKIRTIPGLKIVRYFPWVYTKSRILKNIQLLLHLLIGPLLVRRKFKQLKCDIIDGGYIQRDGIVAALSGAERFLLTTCGSDVLILPRQSFWLRLMARYTIRRASMVYSDSNVVRGEVLEIGGISAEKTAVFPQLGIDVSRFSPSAAAAGFRKELGFAETDKVIISIRNFDPKYNVPGLVDAVAELRRRTAVPFKVLIIGKGPEQEKVEVAIRTYGLENRVRILGYVPNDKLPSYLASSDISVSSSLTDGTPLSLLEAMACGLPVVMTDVPSYHEWIENGKNGFIVPIKDPGAMAEKLAQLLDDPALSERMGKMNRAIAEDRADIDRNYTKLEHLYRFICGIDTRVPKYQ